MFECFCVYFILRKMKGMERVEKKFEKIKQLKDFFVREVRNFRMKESRLQSNNKNSVLITKEFLNASHDLILIISFFLCSTFEVVRRVLRGRDFL